MSHTAHRTANAFNKQGSWTARPVENNLAVEIRHVDTGTLATTVWLPEDGEWTWTNRSELHELPASVGLQDLVNAVTATLIGGKLP
jgi:hypothetical protein